MRIIIAAALFASVAFAATNGDQRVIDAAKNQDHGALKAAIAQKADLNRTDIEGMTALIWAAHQDDLEAVKALLAAGANPKIANRYQLTALSEAANAGDGEMMEALVKAGADVNITYGEGETPLMTASRTGATRGVKALLEKGADVNARDSYHGQTALMWASAENHPEVVKLLIAAGAEVNTRSTLHEFAFRKVAAGGTQAVYSRGDLTPLMFAARQGSIEAAQVLLDAKADINRAEEENGFTPLLEAIYNDHYDFAKMLVDRGADLKVGALFLSVEMRNLDYQGNRPRKAVEGKMDELAFIKYLLDHGADPNGPMKTKIPPRAAQNATVSPNGNTPFIRAARSADVETMKLLIEHGADPNRASDNHTTPIIAAGTGMGHRFQGGEEKPEAQFIDALKILVASGANVNAANDRGDTAMHGAADRGADLIIQFLADHGANFSVKNKQNRTPLDVAMGVGGVANTGGEAHPTTAALIRQILAKSAPANTTAKN